MKVLALFSLILAVATSYPVVKTWTLSALSHAIASKADPGMMPYLMDAMNEIMYALFTGENEEFVHAVVPSPSGRPTWTVEQLKAAIADPGTKEEYRPALKQAMKLFQMQKEAGNARETVEVGIPAMDISTWTLSDLDEALRSPITKKTLIPYLDKAHTELKEALEKGETRETINLVTPVGLIPRKADYRRLVKRLKNHNKKTKKGLKIGS